MFYHVQFHNDTTMRRALFMWEDEILAYLVSSHTKGVQLCSGLEFVQPSQVLPDQTESAIS